ncbi:unnamed protein product [Amaranthus hypochondriacus]
MGARCTTFHWINWTLFLIVRSLATVVPYSWGRGKTCCGATSSVIAKPPCERTAYFCAWLRLLVQKKVPSVDRLVHCNLCGKDQETIEHSFHKCEYGLQLKKMMLAIPLGRKQSSLLCAG